MRMAPSSPRDEAFLDELFDRLVELFADGQSLDLSLALTGHEHLRARAIELVALARQVTGQQPDDHPQFGGFTILRKLGQGGMGTVYLARQERLGRTVALKILPQELTTPRMRERFTREAEALARLRHPNIVTIYDVVPDPRLSAYAMECIDGRSLADLIQNLCDASVGGVKSEGSRARLRNSLTPRATMDTVRAFLGTPPNELPERSYVAFIARLGLAIARALAAVHLAGLLHRDVKPSNILLRRDGTPLLSDFGLVRDADATLTQPGSFAGTPAYAPPEQLRGESEALDARSDIYALGATLFHALGLRLPLAGRNPTELLRQIDRGGPPPLRKLNPRLPVDLETIVSKALEPDPNRRYQSADALADDLERLLTLQPIRAKPAGLLTRSIKLVRRNRGIFAGSISGTLAAASISMVLLLYLVFVPRWVAEHVREARLALLDPGQANNIVSMLYWGRTHTDRIDSISTRARQLDVALAEYAAARRWAPQDVALRREMDVVRAVRDGQGSPFEDVRNTGLHAFLMGDFKKAIRSWTMLETARDPLAEPDPLVSAALGVLYLFDDQPARAYPRLRDAVRAFPNVGFLTLYLADAALQSGDMADAERLFLLALKQPHPDDERGQLRLRAALLAATGRDAEAEALYRAQPSLTGPTLLQFARFLDARGRLEEALPYYATTAQLGSGRGRPARMFRSALERWWAGLSPLDRAHHIKQTLDTNATAVFPFRRYLSVYAATNGPQQGKFTGRPGQNTDLRAATLPGPLHFLTLFAALHEVVLSPSLQCLSLSELAQRMEVGDMRYWNLLAIAPKWKKSIVQAAWRQPVLRPLAHRLVALQSAGAALVLGAASALGQCTSPPCFQGLGDLPGGAVGSYAFNISSDGSTVVGRSFQTAGEEAFRWRTDTGIQGLGDLAGGAYLSRAEDASADGSVISGTSDSATSSGYPYAAFRWTSADGLIELSGLGGQPRSTTRGISDDGSVITGWAAPSQPFRWTAATGMQSLPLPPGNIGVAMDITADGATIFGWTGTNNADTRLLRWTGADYTELGQMRGPGSETSPYRASDDGQHVVGYACIGDCDPFEWTPQNGFTNLGDLAGGLANGHAFGISGDARLVVGDGTSALGAEAVIWDESRTLNRVIDALAQHGVVVPSGWQLTRSMAVTINDNTATLVGDGLNPQGNPEAWIARYSIAPPPCLGDLDDDRDVDLSDLAIALGNYGCTTGCVADLDGDGDMDLGDLSTLLSRYGVVCP